MGRTLGPADLPSSIVLELSSKGPRLITSRAAPPFALVFVAGTSHCKGRRVESQHFLFRIRERRPGEGEAAAARSRRSDRWRSKERRPAPLLRRGVPAGG